MEYTGFGLRFKENDLKMAKRVMALLDSFDYKLEGARQVAECAEAVIWFARLIPSIEDNILEMLSESKPTVVSEEAKTVKRGKA